MREGERQLSYPNRHLLPWTRHVILSTHACSVGCAGAGCGECQFVPAAATMDRRAGFQFPEPGMKRRFSHLVAVFAVGASSLCHGADFTADQVRELLAMADRNAPVDLAGK